MNPFEVQRFHHFDGVHHADESVKDAAYYLDATLMAKRTIPVFSAASPKSKLIKTIVPGGYVGKILSWTTDKTGLLWWQLYDGGFVLMQPGYFNAKVANSTSSGKQIDDQKAADAKAESESISGVLETSVKKTIKGAGDVVGGAGDLLSSIGDNLKWIVLAAVFIGGIFLAWELGLFKK